MEVAEREITLGDLLSGSKPWSYRQWSQCWTFTRPAWGTTKWNSTVYENDPQLRESPMNTSSSFTAYHRAPLLMSSLLTQIDKVKHEGHILPSIDLSKHPPPHMVSWCHHVSLHHIVTLWSLSHRHGRSLFPCWRCEASCFWGIRFIKTFWGGDKLFCICSHIMTVIVLLSNSCS